MIESVSCANNCQYITLFAIIMPPRSRKGDSAMQQSPVWKDQDTMPAQHSFEAYHKTSAYWKTAQFHAHSFYEFFFFLSGNTRLVLEDRTYTPHRGELLIFPPNHMHRCIIDDLQEPYERMYFYVTSSFLQLMSIPQYNLHDIVSECVARRRFRFRLSADALERCQEQIDRLIAMAEDLSPPRYIIARSQMAILLVTVCQEISQQENFLPADAPTPIDNLLKYIQEHLLEDLDCDRLAARFFMSKSHMLHRFKEHTNMSLYQYILVKRVLLAIRLMHQGISATQAALESGFSDYSCFYKAFVKVIGLSPREYLRHINESGRIIPPPSGGGSLYIPARHASYDLRG